MGWKAVYFERIWLVWEAHMIPPSVSASSANASFLGPVVASVQRLGNQANDKTCSTSLASLPSFVPTTAARSLISILTARASQVSLFYWQFDKHTSNVQRPTSHFIHTKIAWATTS
jgi:hypothetical protein